MSRAACARASGRTRRGRTATRPRSAATSCRCWARAPAPASRASRASRRGSAPRPRPPRARPPRARPARARPPRPSPPPRSRRASSTTWKTIFRSEVNVPGLLAVGGGAAVGAWLRWWLGIVLNPVFPTLPLGTLAANLIGGYLMGIALAVLSHFEALPPEARLLITTGFLGGLTTFSTFSGEAATLLGRQQLGWTAALVGAHVVGSIVMTFAGIGSMRLILR